jgi:hypothetical protein
MSPSGTFRTSRDVQLESGMRTKADVRQRLRSFGLTPLGSGVCLSEIKLARTDDEVRREMA